MKKGKFDPLRNAEVRVLIHALRWKRSISLRARTECLTAKEEDLYLAVKSLARVLRERKKAREQKK